MTMEPPVVVMRTGRATRPELVIGDVMAIGCETARERTVVTVGETVTGDVTTAADRETVAGKLTWRPTLRVPEPLRVVVVPTVGVVVTALVVAVEAVPTLPAGGLAALVGDGVRPDVTVGVRNPVFCVAVAAVAVLVGVTAVLDVPKTGAASVLAAVMAAVPAVTPLVTAPVLTPPPRTTAPPPSPPAPLVMTGVGSELMDEFTVCCGLAVIEGETNWPVTMSVPLPVDACPGPAYPRKRPWCPASTAMASEDEENIGVITSGATIIRLCGFTPSVPLEEP